MDEVADAYGLRLTGLPSRNMPVYVNPFKTQVIFRDVGNRVGQCVSSNPVRWRAAVMKQVLASVRQASVAVALVTLASMPAFAQGVTTGLIERRRDRRQQQPVGGASVIAIHEPSGTVVRGDDAGGWPLLHSRHARRRSLLGHRRVHRRGQRASSRRRRQDVDGQPRRRDRSPTSPSAPISVVETMIGHRRSPTRSSARRARARPRRSAARSSRRCPPSRAASTTSRA